MKPRLFVASSTESIDIAYAVQENLDREMEVTVWTQGIFELSQTALASLYGLTGRVDAAAFVFSPNDEAFVRGKLQPAVRDNVVFELGLFVGALGPDKCFVLKPRSFSELNFPSDLMGITPADYEDDRQDGNSIAALGVACNRIRRSLHIDKLHPPVPHGRVEAASSIIQRTLHQIITGNLFRLYFNPPRYKHICFEPGGVISEGRNDNESSWRIVDNQLELVQADGGIHSRFDYDYSLGRFTANGTSGKGLAGQYIVPSM